MHNEFAKLLIKLECNFIKSEWTKQSYLVFADNLTLKRSHKKVMW